VLISVQTLEEKYKDIDRGVTATEESASFISSEYDETKKKLEKSKLELKKVKDDCIVF
jgi:peptidoglycan hydrolase CwlO-like protein